MKATRSKTLFGGSLLLFAAITVAAVMQRPAAEGQAVPAAPAEMVYVGSGQYQPLYTDPSAPATQPVAPFFLDRTPVTNAAFLAFVQENPMWQRSKVKPIFVDSGYLKHWRGDLDFGPDSLANRPVVNVSWFAAQAYAEWKGRRLPTTAEWEVAASASQTQPEGAGDAATRQRLLAWYSRPATGSLPVGQEPCNYWGACDLHGLVWEWVDDFNAALVTGESRNNGDLDLGLFCGSAAISASDFEDYAAFLRFGFRSGLEARYTVSTLGFRTAADAPPSNL